MSNWLKYRWVRSDHCTNKMNLLGHLPTGKARVVIFLFEKLEKKSLDHAKVSSVFVISVFLNESNYYGCNIHDEYNRVSDLVRKVCSRSRNVNGCNEVSKAHVSRNRWCIEVLFEVNSIVGVWNPCAHFSGKESDMFFILLIYLVNWMYNLHDYLHGYKSNHHFYYTYLVLNRAVSSGRF